VRNRRGTCQPPMADPGCGAGCYAPTYARAPTDEVGLSGALELAVRRHRFHARLAHESRRRALSYHDMRAIGLEFDVPLRRLGSNQAALAADRVSFYALLMVSLSDECRKRALARSACCCAGCGPPGSRFAIHRWTFLTIRI